MKKPAHLKRTIPPVYTPPPEHTPDQFLYEFKRLSEEPVHEC